MADWNRYTVAGRLTADPEVKIAENGTQYCNFSVAVNEWKSAEEKRTHFFSCLAYGKIADRLGRLCAKGASVLIGGRLQQDRWKEADTGQSRSMVKLVVLELQMLGPKVSREHNDVESSIDDPSVDSTFITDQDAPF